VSVLTLVQPGAAGRPVTAQDLQRIREAVLGYQRTSYVPAPDTLPSDQEIDGTASAARHVAQSIARGALSGAVELPAPPGSRTFIVDSQGRILAHYDTPFAGDERGSAP